MPVWQQLYSELKDKNFMVVAVAEESRGADHARPWIEQAKSDYWQLIDTEHRLEDLYNLVNVPQAIWIDEKGTIVRPPETAGSTDHFRRMDLKTHTMSPEDQAARLAARQAYLDAVRAWVTTGKYALSAKEARAGLPKVTPQIAEARARFRLAVSGHAGLSGFIVPYWICADVSDWIRQPPSLLTSPSVTRAVPATWAAGSAFGT